MPLSREVEVAELNVYGGSCPNCGGPISDSRLRDSLPCTTCLQEVPRRMTLAEVVKSLSMSNTLKGLKRIYEIEREIRDIHEFFRRCVGNDPWSIQSLWVRRLAKGISFAMIAPTGVGKTTFGIVMAIYYALRGYKSYIIVPTTTLAMQAERKIEELMSKAGVAVNYLVIHSKLPRKERNLREGRLELENGFDILVTTSRYLLKNSEKLLKHKFKFIFVDDVDAVLRGSKAIDVIIKLAGFDDSDIESAYKLIKLRREAVFRGADEGVVEEISRLETYLINKRRSSDRIVVIASATGNPRGTRVKLFRELLGFEIGARPEFIRNVTDLYLIPERWEGVEGILTSIIKRLGSGGLIYVPMDKGVEYAEYIANVLNEAGIAARAFHSRSVKVINEFASGDIKVLVGVATYYGVLVRGIDLPEVIRYAIFLGVPRHKIALKLTNLGPSDILRLLPLIRDVVKDHQEKSELDRLMTILRRRVRRSSADALLRVRDVLNGRKAPETVLERDFVKAYEVLRKYVERPEVIDGVKRHGEISVIEEDGELYVLIPDAATYIQASGRTSRLFLGGISKGVSVVIVDDERLLRGLESRLKWLVDGFRFNDIRSVDLDSVISEVDRDRELIKLIRQGVISPSSLGDVRKIAEPRTILLVVESPNKARTIARFFGKPSLRDYGNLRVYEVSLGNYTLLITASGGHVYDLTTNVSEVPNIYGVVYLKSDSRLRFVPIYASIKRCLNCGYQFTEETPKCPICGSVSIRDALAVVNAIRDVAYEVDEVFIGTDPDTEGEKISYDLYTLVKPYARNVRRIEFHEVTRKAILQALNNPRDINTNLVKAQIVRRVEDRWLGFSLSTLLQTDFWRKYCLENPKLSSDPRCREGVNRNLSAGRVQTPVLGWVIRHYEDYEKSKRAFLVFRLGGSFFEVPLRSELGRLRESDVGEVYVKVLRTEVSEEVVNPPPPYTTDTVLSDIASHLNISAPQAMQILQDLFEMGFITYHRTDSTRVSEAGIAIAREYLINVLGDDYVKYYVPRTWGAGGAHECIRPTRPADAETLARLINEGIIEPVKKLTKKHFNVYDLIFSRFIASQSKHANVVKQRVYFDVYLVGKGGDVIKANEEVLVHEAYINVKFDGFSRFYKYFKIAEPLTPGQYVIPGKNFRIVVRGVTPLLTQASVIKLMKERGIGRPSTYAKILETLFKRNYVIESSRKGYLIPTHLGTRVYSYLNDLFPTLVSEDRTKELERKMDSVENGLQDYAEVINELYEELLSQGLIRV